MEQSSSAAEQRAFAVAKLKRAASLPRMKDGRRPPMHAEAVSEGEKGEKGDTTFSQNGHTEPEEVEAEEAAPPSDPQPPEDKGETAPPEEARVTSPGPNTRSKRRSRSRSRSRTSKDFKGKARVAQSPTPNSAGPENDSSPDESPMIDPPPNTSPPLISPIPSRLAEMQRSPFFMNSPISPGSPAFYPGSSPSTPILPALQYLQAEGLSRSNSAAARMMALTKLTGEPYDPSASPFGSPSPTSVTRNNTVSGGERSAARKNLFRQLGNRTNGNGDLTSGGEELGAPSPPPNRRRRRRSRGKSVNATTPVDDSEPPSTTPNTPIVPPTPLPPTPVPFDLQRAPSASPSLDRNRGNTFATLTGENASAYEAPRKRRSVVVEDDDGPDDPPQLPPPPPHMPVTPKRMASLRVPHTSDAPSNASTDSGHASASVPFFLSGTQKTPSKHERFPSSPFTTPLKEKVAREEDEEEEVLYPAESHRRVSPYNDDNEREISWIADPVPESRIPIQDDYEDEELDGMDAPEDDQDENLQSADDSVELSPRAYEHSDPRDSSESFSKDVVVEVETSPEVHPSYVPPSPSSVAAVSHSASTPHASDSSNSPQVYPARLSVASPAHFERSPSNGELDWEDGRSPVGDAFFKRNGDGSSSSAWEKVKSTFTRSGSSGGRRSRSNSIVAREQQRDHTDSTVSRESGSSLTSPKPDIMGTFAHQQIYPPPPMQSPSASVSVMSLAPQSRSGVSPIPPPSSADLQKYSASNAKLFPFPGMKRLEEERNRTRGMSLSASTPDIMLGLNGSESDGLGPLSASSSNTPATSPHVGGDRKLAHQASDTRLFARFDPSSPGQSSASSRVDYFNISSPPTSSHQKSLPTSLEGAKKWLSRNKLFSSQSSAFASNSSSSPPSVEIRAPIIKPSLSGLLRGRKETDFISDVEEGGSEKSRTPTNTSGSTIPGKPHAAGDAKYSSATRGLSTPHGKHAALSDVEKTPKAKKIIPEANGSSHNGSSNHVYQYSDSSPPFPSPSDQPSSATPDPLSSVSDYPPHSTSGSSSNTSSQYSNGNYDTPQGAVVIERLESMLGHGPRSPMWASAIDEPPRKLLLSSPVLQVVNANTVKDRFLFLFTDLLVIAKPVVKDQDTLLDKSKPNPSDRKFMIKSVVLLKNLRFNADRDEPQRITPNYATAPRHPLIRTFVHQFDKDADHAISSLFEKTGSRDDPIALGQLLFKTLDLDRRRLGDYLSRRTSKFVLKAYLDEFGFAGLRVDRALRVFLHSINIPSTPTQGYPPLEVLLDAFASRWYEANAGSVAYDKDLAVRLVRAIVQLNEVMHGAVAQEPGVTSYPRRNVTNRDFIEAFRRYDARGLVSDDLLSNLHRSIRREKLSQARNPALGGPPDATITIKRPLPPRLTYRIQSEPIILRIPQPDAQLTIHLFGQDLHFEPAELNFAKSSEVSFRVTGTSLGSKTMTMSRSGPNALAYSGLPLSSPVVVERAFMRNTFQAAFADHTGTKRRYMFSVDDPLIRHQWSVQMRRQIDAATPSTSNSVLSAGSSKFHRAAEDIAFKVLQETLVGTGVSHGPPRASAIDQALYRLGSPSNGDSSPGYRGGAKSPRKDPVAARGSTHARSKSRSAVYHRHGPGKTEPEVPSAETSASRDSEDSRIGEQSHTEGRLWSGKALELQCQQNSSIPVVLAFLQVGAPEHDDGLRS